MKRLEGKVAIVTGAGSIGPGWGNGKATAVLFAREGAKVFAVDSRAEAARETRRLIEEEGGHCETFVADVSQSAEVRRLVDTCVDSLSRIDVLHNNVGIVDLGGVVQTSEQSWDRVNAVNLKSVFLTCKFVVPHMQKQRSGSIINISSIVANRWAGVTDVSYAATKAAVIQLTRTVALECAPYAVRANSILPGLMNTPMVTATVLGAYGTDVDAMIAKRDAQCPMGHMGTAWDVAYAALFFASDESKYVTATELVVDGGISAKCV